MGARTAKARAFDRQLGERIRVVSGALFRRKGVTHLARSLGIHHRTLCGWAAGHCADGIGILRLITVHHVSPEWLLHGTGRIFTVGTDPSDLAAVYHAERLVELLSAR